MKWILVSETVAEQRTPPVLIRQIDRLNFGQLMLYLKEPQYLIESGEPTPEELEAAHRELILDFAEKAANLLGKTGDLLALRAQDPDITEREKGAIMDEVTVIRSLYGFSSLAPALPFNYVHLWAYRLKKAAGIELRPDDISALDLIAYSSDHVTNTNPKDFILWGE
ncbi:MAG: hypothetical protein HYZ15_13025 [Sphingobacteriales bacterium]|nr:hypothetical protein [Sphingobacteriales bacterium]